MKIFSFLAIGFLGIAFSACSFSGRTEPISAPETLEISSNIPSQTPSAVVGMVEKLREMEEKQKGVFLELHMREQKGSLFAVDIVLKNENALPLNAVQSWVSFPKEILKPRQIVVNENSAFSLVAPGENVFDENLAIAKIGVSIPEGKNFSEKEAIIASLIFERNNESPLMLEFFDKGSDGKTRVLSLSENGMHNVLLEKNAKNLIIE